MAFLQVPVGWDGDTSWIHPLQVYAEQHPGWERGISMSMYEWLHVLRNWIDVFCEHNNASAEPSMLPLLDIAAEMRERYITSYFNQQVDAYCKTPPRNDRFRRCRGCALQQQDTSLFDMCWCRPAIPFSRHPQGYEFIDLSYTWSRWLVALPPFAPTQNGTQVLSGLKGALRFYGTQDMPTLFQLQRATPAEWSGVIPVFNPFSPRLHPSTLRAYTCNYHAFATTLQRRYRRRLIHRTYHCLIETLPRLGPDIAFAIASVWLTTYPGSNKRQQRPIATKTVL
jgi:hypothetical protein